MSIKLMLGVITILAICIYIFKKTVSGDAENDYRLRDILANAEKEDEEKIIEKPSLNLKQAYNEKALTENVYEQMEGVNNGVGVNAGVAVAEKDTVKEEKPEKTSTYSSYSTNTHTESYNNDVYYEKINDDACETDDQEDYEEEPQTYNSKLYEDTEPDEYDYKSEKTISKKSKSITDYIKTFWRGVTFTTGLLFSLYALYGFTSVHDSNDAIVYSIWLLAGVILLK